jgi:hypothetical protein
MAMDKANSSRGQGRTSKCSTLNTKSPTSKASLPHSLEDKPYLRDNTSKNNDQGRTWNKNPRQRQWKQYCFSMGKKRGTSPKTAQTPKKPKKESKIEQRSLCCNLWQEM